MINFVKKFNKMRAKSFKYWTTQELHEQFSIERVLASALLDDWMSANNTISDAEILRLENLRHSLFENAEFWNEEELKMKFIGQIVELAQIDSNIFRTFYDRSISVSVNEIQLNGTLDMMVATGFQTPRKPFFCVHEYKQELKRDGDPKGQLLVEMIALQAINQSENPIYGCYVLGRNWFFVVLKDKQYAISDAFVATQEDIFAIFRMLKKVKEYIIEMTKS
jgi:hypothetical protein